MNRNQLILAAAGISIFALSCKKDITEMENTYPASTTSNGSLANFIAQHAPAMQQFTINAASGGVLNGTSGAIITIAPNAFLYPNNQPVTGSVTINLQEVYNKRDIIFSGANTTSNGLPLSSGGEVYVTATQGSQQLILANANSVTVSIPAYNNAPPMQEFTTPNFTGNNDFTLVTGPTGQVVVLPDSLPFPITNSRYQMELNSLGWTNCDQYLDPSADQTEFSVPVPNLFNDGNSLLIVTSPSAVSAAQVHFFDAATNVFTCGYYRLTVGDVFTFSMISEINGQFYWDSRTVTITEGISIALNPQLSSESDVMQHIGNL